MFREFDNENNIAGILFHNAITHWYLILIFILVLWLTNKLYVMPHTDHSHYKSLRQRLVYGAQLFVCLAVAAVLTVAGCRGGLQSGVRPITISNANQYVERPTDCALVLNTPLCANPHDRQVRLCCPRLFPILGSCHRGLQPYYVDGL